MGEQNCDGQRQGRTRGTCFKLLRVRAGSGDRHHAVREGVKGSYDMQPAVGLRPAYLCGPGFGGTARIG